MRSVKFALFCLALVLVAACKRGASHSASHGDEQHAHDHEPKTAQITVWTDQYEIFAEHTPPVVNKPSTFITHVTHLQSREPRRQGEVRFRFRQARRDLVEKIAIPARAGIYLPGISFPALGDWNMEIEIDGAKIPLGIIHVHKDDHAAAHAKLPEPPEGISFGKEQQWKIGSSTELVSSQSISESVNLSGIVTAKPGTIATLVSPVSGHLSSVAGKNLPLPGQTVAAGDPLLQIQPTFSEATARLFAAEAEVIRTRAALEQATSTLNRIKKLAAAEAKSARELEEAQLAFGRAEADHAAANALQATYQKFSPANRTETNTFALSPVLLRAPVSGVVSQLRGNIGDLASVGDSLLTIINPESLWIQVRLGESLLQNLPHNLSASLGTNQLKFVYSDLQVDPATRSAGLTFEVDNVPTHLRIGQSVSISLQTARAEKGLVVPLVAIVEEAGKPVAFVQLSGETFEKRDLVLGIRSKDHVQVLSGLKEGERIATHGAFAIRLASVSSTVPAHGHAH